MNNIKGVLLEGLKHKGTCYKDNSLNVIYTSFKIEDIDAVENNRNSKSLKKPGIYLQKGENISYNQKYVYTGKSDNSIKGGKYDRLKQHVVEGRDKKYEDSPNYADRKYLDSVFTIANMFDGGTYRQPLDGNTIPTLEHIFYVLSLYCNNHSILNSDSNTVFKNLSIESIFDVIYPIVQGVFNWSPESIIEAYKPLDDEPRYGDKKKWKRLRTSTNNTTTVFKSDNDIISKHSFFELHPDQIEFNPDNYELLIDLFNAKLCTPYIVQGRNVVKFTQDVNLNERYPIRVGMPLVIKKDSLVRMMSGVENRSFDNNWKNI